MRDAILALVPAATSLDVARWMKSVGAPLLAEREHQLVLNENGARSVSLSVAPPAPEVSGIQRTPHETAPPAVTNAAPIEPQLLPRVRALHAALLAIGALLCVLGILVGVLAARDSGATSNANANASANARPSAISVPVTTIAAPAIAPTVIETMTIATVPDPPPTSHRAPAGAGAPAAPTPRWTPPPRPSPPPVATVPPQAPGSGSAAASAKADCSPPFYFEGTKKVFKPHCI
jgi:serine/threonine-protein kinase